MTVRNKEACCKCRKASASPTSTLVFNITICFMVYIYRVEKEC